MIALSRWNLGLLLSLALPLSSEVAEATLSRSISDSVTVNGRTATSLYSRAARTLTTTSPLGRQGTTTFDLFGRVSEALSPGVAPVASAYDAQGRLSTVTQGARQTLYTYNPQGLLWKIRDPLSREVEFTYDSIGRVRTQKLPDSRIVQFDYDENGNLTSLTPPGRPQHGFVCGKGATRFPMNRGWKAGGGGFLDGASSRFTRLLELDSSRAGGSSRWRRSRTPSCAWIPQS